jgi:hypothetical protein
MRCDDDYAYGGCHLHGPYDPEATPSSTRRDFLVFCLLAHRRHVVPPSWDWAACLWVAANFACYAMEKSDAQDRWGGDNYFSSAMGGRSLRATACDVYGQGAEALTYQGISEEEIKAHDDVGEWEATGRLLLLLLSTITLAGWWHGRGLSPIWRRRWAGRMKVQGEVQQRHRPFGSWLTGCVHGRRTRWPQRWGLGVRRASLRQTIILRRDAERAWAEGHVVTAEDFY